jgi:hypothetical protein
MRKLNDSLRRLQSGALRVLRFRSKGAILLVTMTLGLIFGDNARSDFVTNRPSADTTLFEANPTFNLGASDLTSGSTALPSRSRAAIRFDVSGGIPADAVLSSVRLVLVVTRQAPGGVGSNYRLFRLLRPWGEGTKTGVHGAPATDGEATWNDRFALQVDGNWGAPGAAAGTDFLSAPSATGFISQEGAFTFDSTSNLVADVASWRRDARTNWGWILISDAEDVPQTVTHFGSREDAANAPLLIVEYTSGAPQPAFRIDEIEVRTNLFTLTFDAQPQQSYAVQYLDSVSATNWQTLTKIQAAAGATNAVVSDLISGPQRFYRLQAFPSP